MTEDQLQQHLLSGEPHPLIGLEDELINGDEVAQYTRGPSRRIKCADGLELSVQASVFTYCSPRNNKGPYTHVEVGYPSGYIAKLMPFAEDASTPTDTVYGYVPVGLVLEIINDHGGLAQ